MTIYISLPITGHDLAVQRRAASNAASNIKRLGHTPISPFIIIAPRGLTPEQEYAYYIGEDLKLILQCDAIVSLPGWEESRGCQLESHAARIYGIKQFSDISRIPYNDNVNN